MTIVRWTGIVGIDSVFIGIVASLFVLVLLLRRRRIPEGLELPPGPPGKFFWGNIADMPTSYQWETYTKWAKRYDDLVHIQVLGQSIVIVNSMDIAHELFDRRSSFYSDRFHSTMLNELIYGISIHNRMGWDWSIPTMKYGQRWRQHRRTFHQYFNPNAGSEFFDIQVRCTMDLMQRLNKSPIDFMGHIRHHAGAIILKIVYGFDVLPTDDPYIDIAEKAMASIAEAGNAGIFLVDVLPILKYVPEWIPGASFQRKAHAWRKASIDMVELPFMAVKRTLNTGTARPSMMASLLEDISNNKNPPQDHEEIIRNAGAVAYAGGSDTVVSALTSFVLAMVLYPEVQKTAQNELDCVVGMGRLPTFEDRKCLPYIRALCNEVLRWHPPAPLAFPHRVTQDDVYGRYLIPEGSIVIGNAWAMLRCEKAYGPDPEAFRPERFLNAEVPDPAVAFGFGRRLCPGRSFAEDSLFIAVAFILKIFDISNAKDYNGNDIPVTDFITSGTISHPEPFQCSITPRSASAESLIWAHTDDQSFKG